MARLRVGALMALATTCVMAVAASGADALTRATRDASRMPTASDASPLAAIKNSSPFGLTSGFGLKHHGTPVDHLPGTEKNMELIGELNLVSPYDRQPGPAGADRRRRGAQGLRVPQLVGQPHVL